MTSVVVVGHRDKASASRTNTDRSSSGKRTVKSAEHTDSDRRRQSCNGSTGQRRSDEQIHAGSSRLSSETLDDESSYYAQCVAPVLDEMTRCVHSEPSRSKRHHYNRVMLLIIITLSAIEVDAELHSNLSTTVITYCSEISCNVH